MRPVILAVLLLAPALAAAEKASAPTPTAAELLARYDATMGPSHFQAVSTMTAHRDDGSSRTYKMRMLKRGDDRFRIYFLEPASSRGQEILRQGDNAWLYMPNLKRSVRMANRDSFQGGDFNNADVLRVNYTADYEPTLALDSGREGTWLLELKAKSRNAAYDRVKLWLAQTDSMPVRAEYFSASGKMLRAAEFSDVKDFNGLKRPARVKMQNMLATKRFSELVVESLDATVEPPASRFVLDDLGR